MNRKVVVRSFILLYYNMFLKIGIFQGIFLLGYVCWEGSGAIVSNVIFIVFRVDGTTEL